MFKVTALMSKIKNIRTNQDGMASILITMIMMIVISLIVIGFSSIANREQTQATNNALASQAFYAAETGVNKTISTINTALSTSSPIASQTNCSSANYPIDTSLSTTSTGVGYTCLLVNPTPSVITKQVSSAPVIVPLQDTGGGNIQTLTFTWQTTGSGGTCPGIFSSTDSPNQFLPVGSWSCPYGVLEFNLVPLNQAPSSWDSLQMAGLLVPCDPSNTSCPSSGVQTPYVENQSDSQHVYSFNCTSTACTATIVLGTTIPSPHWLLKVNSLYNATPETLGVSGTTSTGTVNFSGAQVLIDATGKAQNVVRRYQVAVPLTTQSYVPNYAIQSASPICKRFTIIPDTGTATTGPGLPNNDVADTTTGGISSTSACYQYGY